jgi:hypothetical protein
MNQNPDIVAQTVAEPGTSIAGGIWPSLNATLVWALARVDGPMAWDEWKKNTLARHAEVYPDIWYNTWSGPDTLNSTVSKHPGETVNSGFLHYADFPIANLHSHACTLYSASKLLGLEFTPEGLDLAPTLPLDEYRFTSPLVGVIKTATGYEGWYAPSKAGEWRVRLKLAGRTLERRGKSAPGSPMRWSVKV